MYLLSSLGNKTIRHSRSHYSLIPFLSFPQTNFLLGFLHRDSFLFPCCYLQTNKQSNPDNIGQRIQERRSFILLWWSYLAFCKGMLMTQHFSKFFSFWHVVFREQCPKLDIEEERVSRTVNVNLPNDKRVSCPKPGAPQVFFHSLTFISGLPCWLQMEF